MALAMVKMVLNSKTHSLKLTAKSPWNQHFPQKSIFIFQSIDSFGAIKVCEFQGYVALAPLNQSHISGGDLWWGVR